MEIPTPKRRRDSLVLHCTAADFGTVQSIRDFHKAPPPRGRGWDDIGYHFVITNGIARRGAALDREQLGRIHFGRGIDSIGAHAAGWNARALGITMVGHRTFDEEVIASAARLFHALRHTYNPVIPIERCFGHRELPGVRKDCPVIDMNAFRERLQFFVRHNVNPKTVLKDS